MRSSKVLPETRYGIPPGLCWKARCPTASVAASSNVVEDLGVIILQFGSASGQSRARPLSRHTYQHLVHEPDRALSDSQPLLVDHV